MAIQKGLQVFPRAEYLRRLSAVKAEMNLRETDTLVVTTSADITYLSGYTCKSGYVPQGLIISLAEEEPTFVARRCDAPAAMHQMFIDSGRVIGYPEALVANPETNGFDAMIDFLHQNGLAKGRLGIETKSLRSETVEKFKSRMSAVSVVDFSNAIAWVRLAKSDLEIAVMREAAAITDAGMLRAKDVIRPGVREADAAAEIISTLIRGANGKPGTDLADFYLCASPRSATPHFHWSEDVFRDGSQINLEFGGVRHGYVSGLMRTFSIGKPSDRLRRVHEGEVAGLESALAAVKPGATCGDIATAFKRTLRRHGFDKETRCGYAIGIDWMEPTASLKEDDGTVLQTNMTFHLMLGNWIDEDFGYVISETFRVTESGAETFSYLPREIFEI
ncbi:MAG: aminopeptidase P family protein [Mesorhizobium sp.]|uniref:M24 family metallopeptidase n=1 Tax=Mesorhizobium TaxID=68287 RepID=UPI000FE657B9|nr:MULTISPECIES: Xaa-Pro peptidase family protein [Mesorhizobium]MCF6117430.1 Xaa-Pro peptidase family protein [Mesorhizobium muleiense]RWE99204.1 MAG: aminopeptidase P family protein [Mesorhizobium sp.]RWL14758.1 MAG: aminopeptidase P family protein [Mesorhizobium sp.]TIL92986.1 MAG: aminopeptidase P family protein [Mesorhizobium sp.]TIM01293.1 MAG: aminopeptidase P family protein [Mesorhizobium sp.]